MPVPGMDQLRYAPLLPRLKERPLPVPSVTLAPVLERFSLTPLTIYIVEPEEVFSFLLAVEEEEDFEEAKKWWRPAAEQGYVQAIFGMAAICEEELDYNEAMKWYQILADADIDEAKAKVKELKNKVK